MLRFRLLFIIIFSMVVNSCSVSQKTSSQTSVIGPWTIETAKGVSVSAGMEQAALTLDSDGKMHGNTSINRFFGSYKTEGHKLRLDNEGMTRMMGPHPEIEDAVLDAINQVDYYSFQTDGKLLLLNQSGEVVMTLNRVSK